MSRPKRIAGNIIKTLVLPIGMYIVLFILTRITGHGQFGTWSTLLPILQNTMLGSCIALSMTCNMLNNRWDFSIGMMVVLCPVLVMPLVDKLGAGPVGLLLLCIAAGLVLGLINAAAYILIRVPSIVTGIGLMIIYEGFILVYNGGLGARITDFEMLKIGQPPYIFIIGLVAAGIFYVLYTYTKFGYNVRSLAGNQSLAVSTGINEKRNVIGCYLLCGFFVGVAGAIYVAMSGSLTATAKFNGSMNIMFEAFPPVFIGFYLSKYTNLTIGVIIGSLTMKMLTAGMLAMSIPAALQSVGVGLFLLIFIAFTTNQERLREARDIRKRIALVTSYISEANKEASYQS
jgi:ribose transport system permease protein